MLSISGEGLFAFQTPLSSIFNTLLQAHARVSSHQKKACFSKAKSSPLHNRTQKIIGKSNPLASKISLQAKKKHPFATAPASQPGHSHKAKKDSHPHANSLKAPHKSPKPQDQKSPPPSKKHSPAPTGNQQASHKSPKPQSRRSPPLKKHPTGAASCPHTPQKPPKPKDHRSPPQPRQPTGAAGCPHTPQKPHDHRSPSQPKHPTAPSSCPRLPVKQDRLLDPTLQAPRKVARRLFEEFSLPMATSTEPVRGPSAQRTLSTAARSLAPTQLPLGKTAQLENAIYRKIQTDFSASFKGLKKENLWKLAFMERDRINGGKDAYEKEEKGYLAGILNGYLFILNTLNQPLTAELYERLHDESVAGVYSKEEPNGVPKGYRKWSDGKEAFGIKMGDTLSMEGYHELLARYKSYQYKDAASGDVFYPLQEALDPPAKTIDLTGKTSPCIRLKAMRPETCKLHVTFCIDIYNRAPKTTTVEKLKAIARLCQDLDQFHVYVDGNIRSTGILVMNKLLLQNGLSPTVMKDVNQLDCLSEDQIVLCIQEGQQFFQKLCAE